MDSLLEEFCLYNLLISFTHGLLAANLMDTVYESFKDEDGFLYMSYSSEKTFGFADIQIHGH